MKSIFILILDKKKKKEKKLLEIPNVEIKIFNLAL